ncbi:MAG: PD40 domain-containing protein [Bacteroidales bacterium]|nr:PD40 domain-containing protein [Bacteroidales bacterium]
MIHFWKKGALCLAACLMLFCGCRHTLPAFPEVGEAYAITSGPEDHFLANYFGINAWSPDNRYVAILEVGFTGRLPQAGERITLGLVDLQDNNRFIPIATTACWNFQEAAMFHWLPWEDGLCIYNDLRDGKFVSVLLNWKTGEEKLLPRPISAVSKDGKKAVSINYARLRVCRPDYGYAGEGQNPLLDEVWPEDDGLWLMDLETGEEQLILSVAQGRAVMPEITSADGLAYYCHTVLNPDASKIFFLARTVENLKQQLSDRGIVYRWQTVSLTVNTDGSDLRRCFPDGWEGSHFNWKEGDEMVVTARWNAGGVWSHTLFKVGEEEKVRHLAPGILDWDGHCIFSPNGQFISTEGYWNKDGYRSWVLVRVEDEALISLGRFFVPENYKEQYSRCDLHARWRPDGKQLAFNSVHEGSRQVYLRDVIWK